MIMSFFNLFRLELKCDKFSAEGQAAPVSCMFKYKIVDKQQYLWIN